MTTTSSGACCLFCGAAFQPNGTVEAQPHGRRLAFDPGRGRLWLICGHCFRWTLAPLDGRRVAIEALERLARDRAIPVAHTARVVLLRHGPLLLLRVGEAPLHEHAWWRYGRELRSRKARLEGRATRASAYLFGALNWTAEMLGFGDADVAIDWSDTPVADIVRWRRFGVAAWRGRTRCPFCRSTLKALRYDLSWWCYPLAGPDGRTELGVPCPRCDPWTPEHIYRITGEGAEFALRKILAWQNVAGAAEAQIRDAVRAIEGAGSPVEFAVDAARQHTSLWKLGRTGTMALEIALSETVEARSRSLELKELEFTWRREEELARIMDGILGR